MGNFFTSSPKKKKQRRSKEPTNDKFSQVDQAKLELRRTKTKLRKYQKQMEKETERLNDKIKALIKLGKKSQARANLRLRKLRETALEKTDIQVLNLEQMISTIEQSELNVEMVKSIETGNAALGHLQKIMSLEYVEEVMEKAEELEAMNSEITEMISGSGLTVDDGDIAADLEQLEREINDGAVNTVEEALKLPIAPTNEVVLPSGEKKSSEEVEDGRVLVAA